MKIVQKKTLADIQGVKVTQISVIAPEIARQAKPGQFVVLMVVEEGERIPLTIVDKDLRQGTITLIFQEAGLTTGFLGRLSAGDSLSALVGPLGHPTEIKNYKSVILVGGGVGIAEILPVARSLKEAGIRIATILGSRTKELIILEEELRGASAEFYITTDDGSCGRKGFTTEVLRELLAKDQKLKTEGIVYAVGPIPMMKKVAQVTQEFGVKTLVSLNALMVDATGMCGCCRVSVAGETKFSCVDGPDFDAHLVDWEELTKRNRIYAQQEKHICQLLLK